ncbi:MAG: ATP-grasp domain-containing protein [Clostridiales bacterium]|nr:ATP-grasp domain-containing protein [Clostridiales bacterium]
MDEPLPGLRVGLTYNLKKGAPSALPDDEAEFDDLDTIQAIQDALASLGCVVELFEAEPDLPIRLAQRRPDIVFNIAEGSAGRGRESHVPAILSFLQIPYTGSDETAMCLSLDKALAKVVAASAGVLTPGFQVVAADFHLRRDATAKGLASAPSGSLSFPLIVKPNAEGSSKGLSAHSIVYDEPALRETLEDKTRVYAQDMLVEEYIPGREFTVGLLGNGDTLRVFTPMEIRFTDPSQPIYSYEVKRNFKQYVQYACPPDVGGALLAGIKNAAVSIYQAMGCRDFARVDFRLSPDGRLYFIELNPLPGLAPGYSDFPILAEFCGVGYAELIQSVLRSALARYNMPVGQSFHQ